jgi:hypothetical protein
MKSKTSTWVNAIAAFALLATPLLLSAQVTGNGTPHRIPIWTGTGPGSRTLGNSIIFQTSGLVGFGTISPDARIDVRLANGDGDLLFDNPFNPFVNGRASYFRFKCTSSTCLTNFNGGELNIQGGFDVPNGGRIRLGGGTRGDTEVNAIQFFQSENETMRIQDGGNVGIGTTSPAVKLHVIGDFIATGTKSALVETTSYGKRQLYAVESPENWFEDFGGAQLTQGRATVRLDPIFAETVNTEDEYHVFLTPRADCEGLYVANQTATSFEVRELRHGTGSISFDYRIVAKRKGHEGARLAELKDEHNTRSTEMNLAENRK